MKSAADTPVKETHQPLILFDGVCNLCSSLVQFVIRRDKAGSLRFASLQSEAGRYLTDADAEGELDSIILIESGQHYRKSTAALRITLRLGKLWPLLFCFIIVPPGLRDMVYDFVGNRRYRWFGKKQQCWLPAPEYQQKFVEDICDIPETELKLMRKQPHARDLV